MRNRITSSFLEQILFGTKANQKRQFIVERLFQKGESRIPARFILKDPLEIGDMKRAGGFF